MLGHDFISLDLSPECLIGYTAGLRPFRAPTPRLELEVLGSQTILHNYGHGGSGITMCWGSAQEAVNLLAPHLRPETSVAVLGAGAIGLCSAVLLHRAGHRVRIYTRDLPLNTTSAVAGGLWGPTYVGSTEDPHEAEQHDRILRHTWKTFLELDAARYGVVEAPMYETDNRAYALDAMPPGLTAPPQRLEQMPFSGDLGPGQVSLTLLIETPKFLSALEAELRDGGVEIMEQTFEGPTDFSNLPERALVNCLGLGAREVCEDSKLLPIRGQLALFQPAEHSFMLDHAEGYVISRPDVLILGGTFEEGVEDSKPVAHVVEAIVNKHRKVFNILET